MLTPKDEWERKIFREFAASAGITVDPDTLVSCAPPAPDIQFRSEGAVTWFELVEVTDQNLARNHMVSVKTGKMLGGAFSQQEPLERAIRTKAAKQYDTGGARLNLLMHYDKQFPAVDVQPDLIPHTIRQCAGEMLESGRWNSIWVYDGWKRRVLYRFPKDNVSE